ncbi:MAG: hypothetical protein J5641_03585 [Bacteroidales bacterium]|nr:hypothetical protein [Bacteroidales bacterium]
MPTLIQSPQQMERLALEWGFLPFFRNKVEGFSIEEHTPENRWFSNENAGPWEWKGPVIGEWRCAYGKFFAGKAGYVSLEWLPDFINWRRSQQPLDRMSPAARHVYEVLVRHESLLSKELKRESGYTLSRRRTPKGNDGSTCDALILSLEMATYICIADFEYNISRAGQQYGWGVARYCTPEAMYGSGIAHCDRTPQQSRQRILDHLHTLFPHASANHLERMI